MRYIIALFFCLLFPCLSVMGQQTDSITPYPFTPYTRINVEGVGSTYVRAHKDALKKIRRTLRIADYEDIPMLTICCEDLWTKGKEVHVKLDIEAHVVFDYKKQPLSTIKRNKLTARKKTKSEKRKDSQEFEELKFKFNEKEFRKRMEEKFKEYKDVEK